MITRFTILCLVGEAWCYMHEAYEHMPYVVLVAVATSVADTVIERVFK